MIRTRVEQTNEMEHSSPVFLTSSFCFDNAEEMRAAFADETDDNIYSRFSNPTVQEFTDRMCVLEGMESGFATSSGMSAVFASLLTFLKKGDHLISCNAIFGSTHTVITKILPRYGIEFTYVHAADPAAWEAAVQKNTKMIYLETPTNPGLDLIDLQLVGELAKKHNLIYCVDNCFATPIGFSWAPQRVNAGPAGGPRARRDAARGRVTPMFLTRQGAGAPSGLWTPDRGASRAIPPTQLTSRGPLPRD